MSIRVQHLSKQLGGRQILDDVSFSIGQAEVVGLLGPNGAGKTTLMRVLTGDLVCAAGRVEVDGLDVSTRRREAAARVGYLPEVVPLYDEMMIAEYLHYAGRLRGMSRKELNERVDELIGLLDLEAHTSKRIGHLSKGTRQRVGVGSAIIHNPRVLILDEPTTGLDPNQLDEFHALLRQIGRQRTILLSTHIMQEVKAVCSRALLMNAGRIVDDISLDGEVDIEERFRQKTV